MPLTTRFSSRRRAQMHSLAMRSLALIDPAATTIAAPTARFAAAKAVARFAVAIVCFVIIRAFPQLLAHATAARPCQGVRRLRHPVRDRHADQVRPRVVLPPEGVRARGLGL